MSPGEEILLIKTRFLSLFKVELDNPIIIKILENNKEWERSKNYKSNTKTIDQSLSMKTQDQMHLVIRST